MFDLKDFLDNLKENPQKKDTYEKYNNLIHPLDNISNIKELKIYSYLKKFETRELLNYLKKPEFWDEDFDYDILLKLVFGSFSSESDFIFDIKEEKMRLFIVVKANEKKVKKYLNELWGFQIARMFEIYIEEQMNLFILAAEDEKEKKIVEKEQKQRLENFNKILNRFKEFLEYLKLKKEN